MLTSHLRYALRSLRRSPGFTAVAVVTLALGLGATTTVFSLVNSIYFRPLGFPDAARLVDVHEESATRLCAGCGVGTSYPGLQDWQRAARALSAMAGYSEESFTLSGDGDPERIGGGLAAGNLFRGILFGTSPMDPWVMLAVAALLGGVTLLASYLPARRAARVEPMVALRYE